MIPAANVTEHARSGDNRVRLEGSRKVAIETGRTRLLVTVVVMAIGFIAVGARLVDLTLIRGPVEPRLARHAPAAAPVVARADIVDRNGVVLATNLPTTSLHADPTEVLDPVEAADALVRVLPDLDRGEVLARLTSDGRFAWIWRNLTPNQTYQVNRLGLPGLRFLQSERRVYPHGREAAHVLGLTDVDGHGIAGIEQSFDSRLRQDRTSLRLSIDIRIQALLREDVAAAVDRFQALGGAALVLDAGTGEVLALVSLPDFDPNLPQGATGEAAFNRATKGVYEMGSTFKLLDVAMALDSGATTLDDRYDARRPLRVARYTITDYHAQNRWLTVPEILIYSSNIGAARIALDLGTRTQRRYLGQLGLLEPAAIDLPEVGTPLVPSPWRDINTMTIGYGHGIAVSPLQMAGAVATLVNGGVRVPPTMIKRRPGETVAGEPVISAETSKAMRGLMRLVVEKGTGRKADVPGYLVGGKTGTADKIVGRRYSEKAVVSSFVGAFPIDAPRYVLLVLLDEPKGNASTQGFATGGWVAAPVVANVIRRMAPLTGLLPGPGDGSRLARRGLLVRLDTAVVAAEGHVAAD